MTNTNPFITRGYVAPEYFCDREMETKMLTQYLTNGNNVVLSAPRRIGKTGLIQHVFNQPSIAKEYYTFFVDIYPTKNYTEFVSTLGKSILHTLKPIGKSAWDRFLSIVKSLRPNITYDASGTPSLGISVDLSNHAPGTLEEIFSYLAQADRPCIIAIDEFQTICNYPQKNIEAELRTFIHHCPNAQFVFAGSRRHLLGEMFSDSRRPFYQSCASMELSAIPLDKYIPFAKHHFEQAGKQIEPETITSIYQRYDGITWYMQFILNTLYSCTNSGETCLPGDVDQAVRLILSQLDYNYRNTIFYLPSRQKEVLLAICNEGIAENITSRPFMTRHHLTASTIQGALRGLLEKDLVTEEFGKYQVYDRFLAEWIQRNA